ncbi:hypothetical protein BD560DRAFT_120979 [Blakeslea trispora]|nr:hypothetical protein BD560DRAFT_120979 [Blakeslea trispora]
MLCYVHILRFSVHKHHPPGLRACNGMLCCVHFVSLAFISCFSVHNHHPPGLRACNGMLCYVHILCFSVHKHHPPGLRACNGMLCCVQPLASFVLCSFFSMYICD